MLARDCVDRLARSVALVGQPEEIAHLFDGEAEIARPADKTEAPEMRGRIAAIVAGGAIRRRQAADPLGVATGDHFCICRLREIADREILWRHPLGSAS